MTIKDLSTTLLCLSLFAAVTAAALGLGTLLTNARELSGELTQIAHLKDDSFAKTSEVFDKAGEKIGEFASERRYFVPLASLPKHVVQAFLSAEDKDFYHHFGVNPRAVVRSALVNLKGRGIRQGASTITQQLARLYFLDQEKTWTRKIKEALLALAIERRYRKDEILELYLNKIFLGNKSFGIEAAARNYFRKNASDLSVGEAALLAGLPKAPSYYAPHKHPERANKRQAFVLKRMAADGAITEKDARDWARYAISVAQEPEDHFSKAPYFISAVQREFEQHFESEKLPQIGLKIHTTLDMRLQEAAAATMTAALTQARQSAVYKHKHKGQIEGALIAIDPQTGGVLAMQGGDDFTRTQFNRAGRSRRRIGGLFLPLCISLALERGLSLASPIGANKGDPSLAALALQGDVFNAAGLFGTLGAGTIAEHMGHLGLEFNRDDVTMALGYGEATPLQVAAAYASFVNNGQRVVPYVIARVDDADGKQLWQGARSRALTAMRPQTAYMMQQLLMQIVQNGRARSLDKISRVLGASSAATDDLQNAWTTTLLPTLTAAIWVGAETGQARLATNERSAAEIAEHAARDFLKAAPRQYIDQSRLQDLPPGLRLAPIAGLPVPLPFLSGMESSGEAKRF